MARLPARPDEASREGVSPGKQELTAQFTVARSSVVARKARIEYPGAVYHLLSRGNQGQEIFRDDPDRKRFLETLTEACEKTGWQVHAYVLMPNHYHLLVETPEPNLVAGMKWLQGTYTQRFHARYRTFGHVLQGRYKALIVDGSENDYFQVVSTYIHLNPARGGLIRVGETPLHHFVWSSYPAYLLRPAQRPPWLRVDRVLGSVGIPSDDTAGRRGYEAYIEGRVLELGQAEGREALKEEWGAIRRGWYLGGVSFRDRLDGLLEKVMLGKDRGSYSGAPREAHDEAAASALLDRAMVAVGLDEGGLERLPKGAPEKQVLAWWLRRRTTVSRRWIAGRLRMGDTSRVTQALAAVERGSDRELTRLRQRVEQMDS